MKFVTLLEGTYNVHLMKDVGQIPFQLYKRYGVDAHLATFNCDTYSYLDDEVKGLKMDFLQPVLGIKSGYLSVFLYLMKEARSIDVLNLYHIKKRNLIYGLMYRFLNKSGTLYYKFDCTDGEIDFRAGGTFLPVKKLITALGRYVLRGNILVSVEATYSYNSITQLPKEKMVWIPNCFDEELPKFKVKSFEEKENVIVLSGRHGDYSKNSELILEALPQLAIGDWKIKFIGSCTDSHKAIYEKLIEKHPEFAKNIEFTGFVSDRNTLYQMYNDAKIICHPSRIDICPNVISEAMYFGTVPLLTDHLPGSWDLSDNGNVGAMFRTEDANDLARVLNPFLTDESKLKQAYEKTIALSRDKFVWNKVIPRLYEKLSK